MGGGTGRLPGRDVCRDGTFFIPALKTVYHGRRDGMFAGVGRFSSRVYMRMFLAGTISPRHNLQSQHNIVPAKRDGVFT